jgi:hypothetical protein
VPPACRLDGERRFGHRPLNVPFPHGAGTRLLIDRRYRLADAKLSSLEVDV